MNKALSPISVAAGLIMASALATEAVEFHVSACGSDSNPGNLTPPLRTISRAADLAQPGDVITVHEGVYRERINPPRGGASDGERIVYQAAPGEKVEIKGSEVVDRWEAAGEGAWKTILPNSFFGDFNPYAEVIRGDWFDPRGRTHHTGAVYLNGNWLIEAARLEDVLRAPVDALLWFGQANGENTTIWARFAGLDPNGELVEVNARQTVFYPDEPGRNYITVRGFTMRHAATPWAPPTAEQIGLIGTHWSKGWIIEDNVISHSVCSGIALGKYGDRYDNTSANTAEGYVKTIERALEHGWNAETVGGHIVRNNTISHCEQAGIVGSLGCAFSTVSGNTIHDIHVRRLFAGAEMAGIKFHGAVDAVIRGNHIHHTCRGLWLDWMAQGTRVSGNLLHDNADQDLFVEVNHGPFIVDNNLFLSKVSLLDMSEGGAYVHNLFGGRIVSRPELGRQTPFHPAHSTRVAGLTAVRGGDNRFYNNLFAGNGRDAADGPGDAAADPLWEGGFGLWVYDFRDIPLRAGGNVYYNGARPYREEAGSVVAAEADPNAELVRESDRISLHITLGPEPARAETAVITTARLGKATVPNLPYENADGSPLAVDTDYAGRTRDPANPEPGPFESPGVGSLILTVGH